MDAKRRVVAAKAVPLDTPNLMPVRRTDDKQLAFHLGGAFRKYPDLRPITASECLVSIRKDSEGEPCLMIAMQMAQAKSKSRTTSSGTGSAPKQARQRAEAGGVRKLLRNAQQNCHLGKRRDSRMGSVPLLRSRERRPHPETGPPLVPLPTIPLPEPVARKPLVPFDQSAVGPGLDGPCYPDEPRAD